MKFGDNLRNMRKFYEEYPSIEILQTLSAKLTWSHNILLINKVKDMEIRKWYLAGQWWRMPFVLALGRQRQADF